MSEKEMFQREIKRSGYLRGTRMKVVRTKIIFAILAVTVASYAIPAYFYKPDEDRLRKREEKMKRQNEEKMKKLQETIAMRNILLARQEGRSD